MDEFWGKKAHQEWLLQSFCQADSNIHKIVKESGFENYQESYFSLFEQYLDVFEDNPFNFEINGRFEANNWKRSGHRRWNEAWVSIYEEF